MPDPMDLPMPVSSLPLPLAQTLRRAVNATSAENRHAAAYYFFESTLKLCAAAPIGLYLELGCPEPRLNEMLEGLARPSTGQWLAFLREVSKALAERADAALLPLAGLHQRLTQRTARPAAREFLDFAGRLRKKKPGSNKAVSAHDLFEAVVQYRNEELGHGAQRPRSVYAEAGPLLIRATLEAFEALDPFGGLALAAAGAGAEAGGGLPRYEVLRGDGIHQPLTGAIPELPGWQAPTAGHLVLASRSQSVRLHPLLVYQVDELEQDRVGFLNKVTGKPPGARAGDAGGGLVVEYLDYLSGERLHAEAAAADLAALFGRLGGKGPDGGGAPRAVEPASEAAGRTEVTAGRTEWIGDFELLSELGRGGWGIVFKARQSSLGRIVALKVLDPGRAADPVAVARFRREIAALGRCDHPGVVKVLTAGQAGERYYYAMEYIQGCDLAAVFRVLRAWKRRAEGKLQDGHVLEAISLCTRTGGHSQTGIAGAHGSGGEPVQALETPAPPMPDLRGGRDYAARIAEIFADAARAVQHLHQNGILHRDLKPGNILLTSDGKRAVIMDLGLAQLTDQSQDSVSRSLSLLGTLRYMSPEQLQRNLLEVTHLTDVYSLGAALHELASLEPLFDGDSEARLIRQVLYDEPVAAHLQNPAAPEALSAIVRRATAKLPEARYPTAEALAKDLEAFAAGQPLSAPSREPVIRFRRLWGKLRRLAKAAAAAVPRLFTRLTRALPGPPDAAAARGGQEAGIRIRRAVAILGFKNRSERPETAWLSVALSEMLATELASDELRIIPGENVARMKIELSLSDTDSFSPETLARIRTNLVAEYVILGSYLALGERSGGKIRLDVRLQDARAGETVASVAEAGAEEDLFDLVTRVGARLREKLDVGQRPASEAAGVRGALPTGAEAARLYSEGLAKLRVFDAQGALELLRQAVEAEPRYPLAHWALAEAWSRIGYDGKAQQEARRAFELSESLSRQERLSIEARYRETNREWDKAIKLYQMLWGFFPDQMDYGLLLAAAQTAAGQGGEALATVAELRRLGPPSSEDARIDLAEAEAAFYTADYRRMQGSAARAAERGGAAEARLLVARAQGLEGRAYWRLGEPEKALAALEAAKRSHAAAGDLRGQAEVLHWIGGFLHWNREDLAGARRTYEEALDLLRATGNKRGMAEAAFNVGNVLRAQAELAAARDLSEEALANFREVGAKDSEAHTLTRIATLLALQDDVPGARTLFQEARAACRETGKRELESFLLTEFAEALRLQGQMDEAWPLLEEALAIARAAGAKLETALALGKMADLLLDRGQLAEARQRYEDSLEVGRQISSKSRIAYALHGLGGVLLAQGKPVGARRSYDEARAIRQQGGNRLSASHIALAELALEEGLPAEAALAMRGAVQEFQAGTWVEAEAQARLVLGRAELAEGKLAEARKTIRRARALAEKMGERRFRLRVEIEEARVLAAVGQGAEAAEVLDGLEAARAEAARGGFLGLELEARLALGEIELGSDREEAGRARLQELAAEAEAGGVGLVVRKVAAALGKGAGAVTG